jgi:hypothetical protein
MVLVHAPANSCMPVDGTVDPNVHQLLQVPRQVILSIGASKFSYNYKAAIDTTFGQPSLRVYFWS